MLIGWDTGALIACKVRSQMHALSLCVYLCLLQVASKEDVNAVICLGYPFEGISLATKEVGAPPTLA